MCVCVCASSKRWWNTRAVRKCAIPPVSKCTDIPCFKMHPVKLRLNRVKKPKNTEKEIIQFSVWGRASQRAFQCDDIEETFEVLGFTSSLSFTYSSCAAPPPSGGGDGFAIPVVAFFRKGLSSDRSLFSGFVSVICGHYINIHGWPEDWEKGCNTHPDLANRWS